MEETTIRSSVFIPTPYENDKIIQKRFIFAPENYDNTKSTYQCRTMEVLLLKGFGYEGMIWNEAKCADFGNYLL
jgi:hypothetical protein